MDYDKLIIDCIKDNFKSVKEISEETDISYNRVNIRMNSLRKYDMVICIQGKSEKAGLKPTKYKKSDF